MDRDLGQVGQCSYRGHVLVRALGMAAAGRRTGNMSTGEPP